jgi:hypothetical protein
VAQIEGLEVVVRYGAPAQREEARRLIDLLAAHPDDAQGSEAALALVDAYLHDPYLER